MASRAQLAAAVAVLAIVAACIAPVRARHNDPVHRRWLLQDEGSNASAIAGANATAEGGFAGLNATNATQPLNITFAAQLFELAGLTNLTNTTLLAPTNEAFDALPIDVTNITELLTNATLVENATMWLKLHVLPGLWNSTDLPKGNTTLPTEAGLNITFDKEPEGILIYVPGSEVVASVLQPDLLWKGNIVHVIDTVLLPFNTTYDQPVLVPIMPGASMYYPIPQGPEEPSQRPGPGP